MTGFSPAAGSERRRRHRRGQWADPHSGSPAGGLPNRTFAAARPPAPSIPQAGFTLQSLFRFLRYATGNEISIDGEIVLEGDDATLKVRVAGKPPTVAKGPQAEWERLVGDLAGGVLEVTQPAVHAAWLGQKATTPAELAALSKYLRRMLQANPPHSAAVLSVAYAAYGSALERQGRSDDALRAFDEAMKRDRTNGVSVVNAARARSVRRDYAGAAPLYLRAQSLQLPDAVKIAALRSRVFGATNTGDCDAAARAFADAKRSPLYQPWRFIDTEATLLLECEFEEARAVSLVSDAYALHPEDARLANVYASSQFLRPEGRYREHGFKISCAAIAAGVENPFVYGHFWWTLLEASRFEEADEINGRQERLLTTPAALELARAETAPLAQLARGDYAKADKGFTRHFASSPPRKAHHFWVWARAKTGHGQHDQAVALLRDGLKQLPRNCRLWQELGSAQAVRGLPEDISAALATFDQGIAAVPKCGLTTNAAARLLIAKGRPAEAKTRLDSLIKIAPNSDGALIAKEILAGVAAKP